MSDSKRWRTLMKRLAYLRAEASETLDIFEESISEIEARIKNKENSDVIFPKDAEDSMTFAVNSHQMIKFTTKSQESSGNFNESVSNSIQENLKDEALDVDKKNYKRLWRSIAKMTHPDIAGNNKEFVNLYKVAADAYEHDKREELLDIASEINVQLDNPPTKMLEDINRRCLYYEQMLKKIKDSITWEWKYSQEARKKEILDLIKSKRAASNVNTSH